MPLPITRGLAPPMLGSRGSALAATLAPVRTLATNVADAMREQALHARSREEAMADEARRTEMERQRFERDLAGRLGEKAAGMGQTPSDIPGVSSEGMGAFGPVRAGALEMAQSEAAKRKFEQDRALEESAGNIYVRYPNVEMLGPGVTPEEIIAQDKRMAVVDVFGGLTPNAPRLAKFAKVTGEPKPETVVRQFFKVDKPVGQGSPPRLTGDVSQPKDTITPILLRGAQQAYLTYLRSRPGLSMAAKDALIQLPAGATPEQIDAAVGQAYDVVQRTGGTMAAKFPDFLRTFDPKTYSRVYGGASSVPPTVAPRAAPAAIEPQVGDFPNTPEGFAEYNSAYDAWEAGHGAGVGR